MDKRAEFRFNHDRKLETYADMAGMTIYRDVHSNKIVDISYVDYSFGDPREAWRKREELFRPDPDEMRLPDKTCDRYFYDYWMACGGPYRHMKMADDGLTVQQIAEAKAKNEKYLHERKEERRRGIERKKRREERARANAERINTEREKERMIAEKARILRRERQADAIRKNWVFSAPPSTPTPPWKPPKWMCPSERLRQYQQDIARRLRQKKAMDSGAEFSTEQRGDSGVITWSDPHITDVRMVRLVLGSDRRSREMTAKEESDYWYWKARGK